MSASAPPILCVRCAYYERIKTAANPLYSISPHICHAFVDLVTGDPLALPARDMRARDGGCGPEGARFEAFEKEADLPSAEEVRGILRDFPRSA